VTQARLLGLGNAEQHAVQVVKHGAGRPWKQRPDQPRSSIGAGRGLSDDEKLKGGATIGARKEEGSLVTGAKTRNFASGNLKTRPGFRAALGR
jgi:hypothetical protein